MISGLFWKFWYFFKISNKITDIFYYENTGYKNQAWPCTVLLLLVINQINIFPLLIFNISHVILILLIRKSLPFHLLRHYLIKCPVFLKALVWRWIVVMQYSNFMKKKVGIFVAAHMKKYYNGMSDLWNTWGSSIYT